MKALKAPEINSESIKLGSERSVIREIFEYGNMRAGVVGRENVYDFSLGNPAVPTPECINDTIRELVSDAGFNVHGYTSAQGALPARQSIAESITRRFGVSASPDDIYITCGAAASLTITLNALCNKGDEVIAFAPYFPEYKVFVEGAGAELCVVSADTDKFQINFEVLEKTLTEKTKAVIINSPNNPSGSVLTENTVLRLCSMLRSYSERFGHAIYLISDEPYRELVYDGALVPYIPKYYDDSIVCYSYSKSLSLAGERIGYIFVNPSMKCSRDVYAAVCGAGRKLGFVCAPSLMQYAVAKNPDAVSDVFQYKENRDILYGALTEYGYECVPPDGAFYLFVKSPLESSEKFCELARGLDLLLVPSDSFGCPGYLRISYCVSKDMILRSLPLFKKLIAAV